MIRYQEALNRCLEAIAAGDDLESILAGLPARHRERLRRDATLSAALRRHAATQPVPTAAAEINALSRLNAELNSVRAASATAASRGGFFGVPRFALAGLLLAALLLGASFLIDPSRGGDGTVEAAEFEGVVIASGDGSLTVQTLDTLEEIMVPLSAQVLDENGIKLELAALAAGEVVSVRGSREQGGPVHALDVRRLLNGLPGWCNENPERCRQIAQNLTEAQERCQRDPEVCRLLHDRVTDLVTRVTDVADLEDLKRRCRGAGGGICEDIIAFCREHTVACSRDFPPGPVTDRLEDVRDRLQQLRERCHNRDTQACRLIAQICAEHAGLCSDAPLPPQAPLSDEPTREPAPVDAPATDSQPSRTTPVEMPTSDHEPSNFDADGTDSEPDRETSSIDSSDSTTDDQHLSR